MKNIIRIHFNAAEEEMAWLEVSTIGASLVKGFDKILQVHPAIGKTVTEQLTKLSKEITFKILPSGWYSCEIPRRYKLIF